jgi:hypothetical protein
VNDDGDGMRPRAVWDDELAHLQGVGAVGEARGGPRHRRGGQLQGAAILRRRGNSKQGDESQRAKSLHAAGSYSLRETARCIAASESRRKREWTLGPR